MADGLKLTRQRQSRTELQRLRTDLAGWQKTRTGPDLFGKPYRGQYDSQLQAIADEVSTALTAVEHTLDFDVTTRDLAQVYIALARVDRQVIWIRQAWEFFRAKFDQRDSMSLLPALAAADEVVWSCFKPFFDRTGIARPPAPLAYVELDYLPSAILASQGHQIERLEGQDEGPLTGYFEALPLPVLRLPPVIVSAPWALALIAHEMGHFVLPFLDQHGSFLSDFRTAIRQAVAEEGGSDEQAASWQRWSQEIFADWFAVVTVGSWAAWAIAQYEYADSVRMRSPKVFYPAPDLRLWLLIEIARLHNLPTDTIDDLITVPPEDTVDRRIALRIAAHTMKPLAGFGQTLAELVSFRRHEHDDPAPGKALVPQWAEAMRKGPDAALSRDFRYARLLAAAAVRAWRAMSAETRDADQELQTSRIRQTTFDWIAESADPERRSSAIVPKVTGKNLASRLLDASDEQLFDRRGMVAQ
jgi:hypothetical protein